MAFGRLERPQGSQPMSEINMTPLIDVMLVLLVIFMLTAPLMTSRLQLDLPKADAPPSPKPPPATLQIALSADGKTYLADVEVKPDALAQQATLQGKQKPDTEVQLRADRTKPAQTTRPRHLLPPPQPQSSPGLEARLHPQVWVASDSTMSAVLFALPATWPTRTMGSC
jgi:biopolymer transport protein TolR